MTIVILEFWLIIRTEVDSAKKFTQSICNNFVLTFDGMGIIVELVNSFSIDFCCLLIGFQNSARLTFGTKFLFFLQLCLVLFY